MRECCFLSIFCAISLFAFGCVDCRNAEAAQQLRADNGDKKLLYIKCSQFENKKCLSVHTLEESCAGKDENGNVYVEVDGEQLGVKNGERLKIYNFNTLWFFRSNFGFDDESKKTHVAKTTGEPGEDEGKKFIGGDKSCVCGKGKKIPGGAECKTVPSMGNCYVYLGNGIVDMQGYDIMGSVFSRIDVAFGNINEKPLVSFFPTSSGDMITATYINDRLKEYKETIVTLFNTIKFGIVLAKNADEFKEYINKAADRFDEYYKLETNNYTYGLYLGKEKIKALYTNELKRIAKVRNDLLEIVDVYKDGLFMTDEELAQNKLRRLNSFGERDPEADECGRYSL